MSRRRLALAKSADRPRGIRVRGRTSAEQIRLFGWVLALGIVLLAGLMTGSRGGALAMLVATLVVCGASTGRNCSDWRFALADLRDRCLDRRQPGDSRISATSRNAWTITRPARSRNSTRGGPRRAIWDADFKALPDYCLVRGRRRQPSRDLSDVSDRFLGSRIHARRERLSASRLGDRPARPGAVARRESP